MFKNPFIPKNAVWGWALCILLIFYAFSSEGEVPQRSVASKVPQRSRYPRGRWAFGGRATLEVGRRLAADEQLDR